MRATAGIVVAISTGLALGGCGSDPAQRPIQEQSTTPTAAVEAAAARTFAASTLSVDMSVASPDGHYSAEGLLEPSRGRFRVELADVTESSRFTPTAVVGLAGEGFENTVSEGPSPGDDQRCWFNPHAPVGSFLGTASVEESVRLVGSILESLPREIRDASRDPADGSYSIELLPSASRPSDDFRDSDERVWGGRALLEGLAAPVQLDLGADGDEVQKVVLELHDYQPYDAEIDTGVPPIDTVDIEAQISPTSRALELDPPGCQAIE